MNRQTWATLQDVGVAAGTLLPVDAFFYSSDEARSSALAADLRTAGWDVNTETSTRGLFRKRTTWAVQANKTLPAGLDTFDAMVRSLALAAERHDVEFDGWGAEAPGDGERAG